MDRSGDRRGRDRMIVGFTTTYAITVYHHYTYQVWVDRSPLCDNVVGLWRTWSSLCSWSVCVVSSMWELLFSVCVWAYILLSPTASFLFAFHWLMRWAFRLLTLCKIVRSSVILLLALFTARRREVFRFRGLAAWQRLQFLQRVSQPWSKSSWLILRWH